MRFQKITSVLFVAAASTLAVGCSSDFVVSGKLDLASGAVNFGADRKVNPFTCSAPTQGQEPIRRLSKTEYSNTLLAIVGSGVHTQVADVVGTLYSDELVKSISDFSHQIDDAQMTAYQSIAERVRAVVSADMSKLGSAGFSCANTTPLTTACRDQIISTLGLRAFRRPLTTAETTQLRDTVLPLGTTNAEKIGWILYTLLQSPSFLLRLEAGAIETAPGEYALSQYEIASRISYAITDSPPDSALYAAAQANSLTSVEAISPHVDRLFETAAAKAKIKKFFNYWLKPNNLPSDTSLPADFKAGVNVTALNLEYQRELDEFIEYVVFKKRGSIEDLLLSREAFPRTDQAAQIMGARKLASTDTAPSQTDENRVGVFMRPSILTTDGSETHPIVRGAKFRLRYFCEHMGLPEGALLAGDQSFASEAAKIKHSTRYRTEVLTGTQTCMACHSRINPVGFAFEGIDNIGRVRDQEKVYSNSGALLATHSIDTSVQMIFDYMEGARSASDGVQLMTLIAEKNQLPACFAKQMHRFYELRQETPEDSCVMKDVYAKLAIEQNAAIIDAFKTQVLNWSTLKRRVN